MHYQRIQGHANTNRAAATNAASHINGGDIIARRDHNILIIVTARIALVHVAIDIGLGNRVMNLDTARNRHTNRTTNAASKNRRNRSLVSIGSDRCSAAGIGCRIITDIGNVRTLDHRHTK